jgi:hypothetical protein
LLDQFIENLRLKIESEWNFFEGMAFGFQVSGVEGMPGTY